MEEIWKRSMERFESIYYAPITRRLKNGGIMIYNWQDYNKAKCNPLPRLYPEKDAARWRAKERRKKRNKEKEGKKRSWRREGTKEEWPKFGATLYRPPPLEFYAEAPIFFLFFFTFFYRVTRPVKTRHTSHISLYRAERLWMPRPFFIRA